MKITDKEYNKLIKIFNPEKFKKSEIIELENNLSNFSQFDDYYIYGILTFVDELNTLKMSLDIYKLEDEWFVVDTNGYIDESGVKNSIYKFDGFLELINFINTIKLENLNNGMSFYKK